MNRLETISKDLSDRILEATIEKKREIIFRACKYAIDKTMLDNPIIINILKEFNDKKNPTADQKKFLENLINNFENDYFDLQEADKGDNGEYLVPFGKARALSAILYCFTEEFTNASIEAVYEASMVNDDNKELFSIIESILNNWIIILIYWWLPTGKNTDCERNVKDKNKSHLGEKAFISGNKMNPTYKDGLVPKFDFSDVLFDKTKPIIEPQILTRQR